MSNRYVTISVDDGYPADFKAADLLHKYGLQATFYISVRNPERSTLTPGQVRELSTRFEIGSHTLNHTPLKFLKDDKAAQEITDGKKHVEEILGSAVISFCYPRGKFNRRTPALVKKAGFLGARTALSNLYSLPTNPFLFGVSTHAYSFSKVIHVRHALLEGNFAGIRNFIRDYKGVTDWLEHFIRGVDYVERHGGVAHLSLHSWEMEAAGEWKKLETALDLVSQRSLTPITNGAIFRLCHQLSACQVPSEAVAEFAGRHK